MSAIEQQEAEIEPERCSAGSTALSQIVLQQTDSLWWAAETHTQHCSSWEIWKHKLDAPEACSSSWLLFNMHLKKKKLIKNAVLL